MKLAEGKSDLDAIPKPPAPKQELPPAPKPRKKAPAKKPTVA